MNNFKQARNTYDEIEIPEELTMVVKESIDKQFSDSKKKQNANKLRFYKMLLASAAVILAIITVGLNTNQTFAMELQKVPVIGYIAKVLTIRSYKMETENERLEVKIPAVTEETENITPVITDVNAEIERICEDYVIESQMIVKEYKKAFFETGGTEEEWKEHDIKVTVDYEIKAQTEEFVSFKLFGTQNWAEAYNETRYYNINLNTGEKITLEEVLGSDYISKANESIKAQMEQRLVADKDLSYFDETMDGFSTITEDTHFYINESGNPVIVFAKYEIAPGAFGAQEFEIKK